MAWTGTAKDGVIEMTYRKVEAECPHENEQHVPGVVDWNGDPVRLGHQFCWDCGRIVYDEVIIESCG